MDFEEGLEIYDNWEKFADEEVSAGTRLQSHGEVTIFLFLNFRQSFHSIVLFLDKEAVHLE